MRSLPKFLLVTAFVLQTGMALGAPVTLSVWSVDSLIKVFPSDKPPVKRPAMAEAWGARNQYVSFQLALRSAKFQESVSAECDSLREAAGGVIRSIQVRPVAYVVVGSSSPDTPQEELIGEAPGWYPDALLDFPIKLEAGRTHAIWVTVHVPMDAAPGRYQGTMIIHSGQNELARSPLRLQVVAAHVPQERTLKVTNWFTLADRHCRQFFDAPEFSDAWWQVIENVARVMGEHRQNVILTPMMSLISPVADGSQPGYDFTHFDQWVETFLKIGSFDYIEGGHLLGRAGGYNEPLQVATIQVEEGKIRSVSLPPDDPRVEAFLASFLTALNRHLEEKGWKSIYLQHILDEPHGKEPAYYARFTAMVRRYLPGVPTIDAIDADHVAPEVQENSDIWVPLLGRFDGKLDLLQQRMQSGHEVWFYTCLYPRGRYMNRLIDFPLIKTRLLHWFNYRENLTGFLHWGGNYWTPEPLKDTQPVINMNETYLPAGDAFIVYPDSSRKSLYSSIRLEAMREGIEDYELLRALAKRNPAEADHLAKEAVTSITEYVRDPGAFRQIQRRLLEEASK